MPEAIYSVPVFKEPFPSESPCFRHYIVSNGETMGTIAEKFNVPIEPLIRINQQLANPNLIFPGQVICLPPLTTPREIIYRVKPGDTMFQIAQRNNITVRVLAAANGQIPVPNHISLREIITIPVSGEIINGITTYYDPHGAIPNCALDSSLITDYGIAAINRHDYSHAKWCGAYIEVTGPKGTTQAFIVDKMGPERAISGTPFFKGQPGGLDLDPNSFAKIEDPNIGFAEIKWRIIPSPLPLGKTIQYYFSPDSSRYWIKLQIRNHLYPVDRLEIKQGEQFIPLPRTNDNYFTFKTGRDLGEQFTFQVTSYFGQTVIDSDLPLRPGDVINGNNQFPLLHNPNS